MLDVDVPDDLPAIRGDRGAIARAVWNLLDNAVKYSRDRPRVRLSGRVKGELLEIAVRDEGIGIAAEEHARIFHKFVRGTAAATSDVKGTGIGLSMVQHIVRAHGGEVCVESQPGRGSTFTIVLPVDQSAIYSPVWTPDGTGVVFLSDRREPGRTVDLWLLTAAGRVASGIPELLASNLGGIDAGWPTVWPLGPITRDGAYHYLRLPGQPDRCLTSPPVRKPSKASPQTA